MMCILKCFNSYVFKLFIFSLLSQVAEAAVTSSVSLPPLLSANELSETPQGKLIIEVQPPHNLMIELPDGQLYDFGLGFYYRLITRLQNNEKGRRFLVSFPGESTDLPSNRNPSFPSPSDPASPAVGPWPSSFVPAARISFDATALSFITGSRGERMFYGFDERLPAFFDSDLSQGSLNEFPLRTKFQSMNWFGKTFDVKGGSLINSQTGLDIGDGVEINAIMARLAFRYAHYEARFSSKINVDSEDSDRHEYSQIDVNGTGFFFDFAAGYQNFSGEIQVTRKVAMVAALDKALDAAQDAIIKSVQSFPLTARIDGHVDEDTVLLGTGYNADIPIGLQYEAMSYQGPILIRVEATYPWGAVGKVVQGDPGLVTDGDIIRESQSDEIKQKLKMTLAQSITDSSGRTLAAFNEVHLTPENLPQPEEALSSSAVSEMAAGWLSALKSVTDTILLGYRVWRYFQYDRAPAAPINEFSGAGAEDWSFKSRQSVWAKEIGLGPRKTGFSPVTGKRVVAMIDSGVDYNHPILKGSFWINPRPTKDEIGRMDRFGWDFISGDDRPSDDHYHGTQVTSAVIAIAPEVVIMPLKVFNPFGITSSAAILAAFDYAIEHEATLIVCPWATEVNSKAIESGVERAQAHGIPVVVAAGEGGFQLAERPVYPAALSGKYDNLLVVTAIDSEDQLIQSNVGPANFDAQLVHLAVPVEGFNAAEPRGDYSKVENTGIAAGIAAGVVARATLVSRTFDYRELLSRIKQAAIPHPRLKDKVQDGLVLQMSN